MSEKKVVTPAKGTPAPKVPLKEGVPPVGVPVKPTPKPGPKGPAKPPTKK